MAGFFMDDLRSAGWEHVHRHGIHGRRDPRNPGEVIPSTVTIDPIYSKRFGIATVVLYPGARDFRIDISIQKADIVTHSAKLLVPAFSSVAHFESFVLSIVTPLVLDA